MDKAAVNGGIRLRHIRCQEKQWLVQLLTRLGLHNRSDSEERRPPPRAGEGDPEGVEGACGGANGSLCYVVTAPAWARLAARRAIGAFTLRLG